MAQIIELYMRNGFRKTATKVDPAGTTWGADPVRLAKKEVGLSSHHLV